MHITPDHLVLFEWGPVHLNATIVYTWAVMLLLTSAGWFATRKIRASGPRSRWQNAMEAVVLAVRGQIREVSGGEGYSECLPFIGTLFLFIAVSNELHAAPAWHAPTASLSTTLALALCVAFSVPLFGIRRVGLKAYLHHYVTPVFFMLPIHMVSEVSRTIALAVRLFGNMMSGSMVVALLLLIAPLFVPVLMQALDLIIGLIQAYIFSILAMVYIAAAIRHEGEEPQEQKA
jgi:F-type H+-transporting ATPase subunit a